MQEPVPPQPAAAPGPPPPARRRRLAGPRARLALALTLGVSLLLCLGGVAVAVSLYDGATEIKRSAPDAVVDSFLRAYLVNRDDDEVALYSCTSGADLSGVAGLRGEALQRERDFGVRVTVTWGSLTVVEVDPRRRIVTTDLKISGIKDSRVQSRRTEQWRFDVVDQDGWRVCGGAKVA